ncbi:MAG: class I SAM-dependent methyltransferase [Ktedonobacterales bacterium]|nr:class I SAM-dependent methyltransferase [Ktedonobacterales bacterium]
MRSNNDFEEAETYKLPVPVLAQHRQDSGPREYDPAWDALRSAIDYHLLRDASLPSYHAPLGQPRRVLDIGCDTGQWAVEMAMTFPNALVVGIDQVVAPAAHARMQGNCQFVAGDYLTGLPFANGTFDYTHLKLLAPVVPINQWYAVLREALRVTRADGWVEVTEMALPQISHPIVWIWMAKVGRSFGYELFPGKALERWLDHLGARAIVLDELRLQHRSDYATTTQMMISEGIALLEAFRENILAQGLCQPFEIDHELRMMEHNLLRTDREDALPLITAWCQPAT